MSKPNFFHRAARLFGLFGAANRAAAATEAGRRPSARTLRDLDIDPEQFDKIGR